MTAPRHRGLTAALITHPGSAGTLNFRMATPVWGCPPSARKLGGAPGGAYSSTKQTPLSFAKAGFKISVASKMPIVQPARASRRRPGVVGGSGPRYTGLTSMKTGNCETRAWSSPGGVETTGFLRNKVETDATAGRPVLAEVSSDRANEAEAQ